MEDKTETPNDKFDNYGLLVVMVVAVLMFAGSVAYWALDRNAQTDKICNSQNELSDAMVRILEASEKVAIQRADSTPPQDDAPTALHEFYSEQITIAREAACDL